MEHLPNIKIIGLTGMSGAGKSTVCGLFALKGYKIIDCDGIARKTARNPAFLGELQSRFPERLLNADGSLDRAKTAELIFSDSAKLELYDRIIFPYIVYDVIREIKAAARMPQSRCQRGDTMLPDKASAAESGVVMDAPTLFESSLDMLCTDIVGVIADREVCAERITLRDGITRDSARSRLAAQRDGDFFRERCGFILENNGDFLDFVKTAEELTDRMKGTL